MESIISIKELCDALGVEYDRSKSSTYYLHMVKEYRLHYVAAQQSVHPTNGGLCAVCNKPANYHEDHDYVAPLSAISG